MQGIGNGPGYKEPRSRSLFDVEAWNRIYLIYAAHEGKGAARWVTPADAAIGIVPDSPERRQRSTRLAAPTLREVLWSLCMDANVIDSPSFEDWASDCGYDEDSRKAEAVYNACIAIAIKLRAMIGDSTIEQLNEAMRDD